MGLNLFGKEVSYGVYDAADRCYSSKIVTQELFILTQQILNTLNTEPDRFHTMSELPGLENCNQEQLIQVARYLFRQDWIKVKALETGFQIKLTIRGKILMTNDDG